MSGLVTPEAVVLDFDTAGLGSRIAAQVVDVIIRAVALLLFVLAGQALDGVGPGWLGVTVATFGIFAVTIGYSVLFETLCDGVTPGKAVFGLRVVTIEGAPIRFRHAVIRGALATFEILPVAGTIAALSIVSTSRHQRLGDIVAGTLVLRERKAAHAPVPTRFVPPQGTESYVSTLDVTSLTAGEYITIRSFLLRAPSIAQMSRHGLADQLGRQFVTRLRTTPPPWMTAEVFLVCVAAAYQERFANQASDGSTLASPARFS